MCPTGCTQVRKYSEPIDNGANMLVPVPGAGDGPGGVIVCAENFLIYKNMDHPEVGLVCWAGLGRWVAVAGRQQTAWAL